MVGNFFLIKCQCENSLWIYHNNYSDHKGKKGRKWLNSYFNILLSCKISNLLAFWLALTSFGIKKQGQLFSQKRVLSLLCNTENIKHIRATACQNTSVPLSSPAERSGDIDYAITSTLKGSESIFSH